MSRKSKRKGHWVLLCWTLALVILSLAFHWELPGRAANDIYVPTTKINLPAIKIANFDRGIKFYPTSAHHAALSGIPQNRAPALLRSLIRTDRKQNLRLWPVVASGELRSPPAF